MKKKTYVYIGVLGIILFLSLIASQSGMFSTIVTVDGTKYDCTNYNEGYWTPNADIKQVCEGTGDYTCRTWTREVSSGTFYGVQCQEYCYVCDGDKAITSVVAGRDDCDSINAILVPGGKGGNIPTELLTLHSSDCLYGQGPLLPGQTYCTNDDKSYMDFDQDKIDELCQETVNCYTCSGGQLVTWQEKGDCSDLSGFSETKPDCESTAITCYACNGDQVVSKEFDDRCGTGYSSSRPTCTSNNNDVTCYACNGDQVVERVFSDSCPDSYTRARPNCENMVTCYTCDGDSIMNEDFDGQCPSTWSETRPTTCSSNNPNAVDCYLCEDGIQQKYTFPDGKCGPGWNEEPKECKQETFFSQLFNFKEEPIKATLIIVAITMILLMIMVFILKPKEEVF